MTCLEQKLSWLPQPTSGGDDDPTDAVHITWNVENILTVAVRAHRFQVFTIRLPQCRPLSWLNSDRWYRLLDHGRVVRCRRGTTYLAYGGRSIDLETNEKKTLLLEELLCLDGLHRTWSRSQLPLPTCIYVARNVGLRNKILDGRLLTSDGGISHGSAISRSRQLGLVEKRGHIHERPLSASRCSKFRIFLCCWRWPLVVRNEASLDGCWITFGARGWRWSMMIRCFWFSETGASCRRPPTRSIPSLSLGFNADILEESFT